jgi:hypothetical protein
MCAKNDANKLHTWRIAAHDYYDQHIKSLHTPC